LNALAEERGEGSDFRHVIEGILSGKNEYEVFLAETYAKIEENKFKLHGEVSKYLILRKNINDEKDNLKTLGDKKAISQSILSFQQCLKELREESQFSDIEEKAYKALKVKEHEAHEKFKNLNKQKELLTKIKAIILGMSGNVLETVLIPQFSQIRNEYMFDEEALGSIDEYANKMKDVLIDPLEKFASEEFVQLETIDDVIKSCLEGLAEVKKALGPYEGKLKNKSKFEALGVELAGEVQKLNAIKKKELEIATLEKKLDDSSIFKGYQSLYECYISIVSELQKYRKIDVQSEIKLLSEVTFNSLRFDMNFSAKISKKTSLRKQFGDMFGGDENEFIFRIDQHVNDVRLVFHELVDKDIIKLNRGFNLDDVVHAIMDDNFDIEYDLMQGDDRLLQMSPGKRGIILFQLFLQLSHATTPILIDQPEDNLDNRTVYLELNNFIKRKKLDRHIIIVSHNANLVVSTDSEEIIVANQHGENREALNAKCRFEYITGSLENKFEDSKQSGILCQKGIRNHVCEILEGGEEAFKKREQKYSLT